MYLRIAVTSMSLFNANGTRTRPLTPPCKEQGAPIDVSLSTLENIAAALQLTEQERQHLLLLAGHTPAEPPVAQAEHVSEVLRRVLNSVDPNPAVVRGRRYDVLPWNRAACAVFGDYATKDIWHRNTIWRFFMDPTAPPVCRDHTKPPRRSWRSSARWP